MFTQHASFFRDLWSLIRPYWFSSEKWAARGLLAAVVALNLGLVYLDVVLSYWQNDFYNTLQSSNQAAFFREIMRFCWIAAGFIVIAVYELYLNQMLQIRWRSWLTENYLEEWIGRRAYYRMQLADRGTDNPDQRIAEDLAQFCEKTLALAFGLMSAVITLLSFLTILWTLSVQVKELPWLGPVDHALVYVAVLMALFGTVLLATIENLFALNQSCGYDAGDAAIAAVARQLRANVRAGSSQIFVADAQGNLKEVHTVEVKWEKNDKGQFVPVNVPGTEKVRPAQLVLLAMGFVGPEQPLLDAFGLERDARTNIKADHEKYVTNVPGVFAAGDCRRGQSLVVWAFNEGRGVARECDRFLMGKTELV